jgi:hypothetical protein
MNVGDIDVEMHSDDEQDTGRDAETYETEDEIAARLLRRQMEVFRHRTAQSLRVKADKLDRMMANDVRCAEATAGGVAASPVLAALRYGGMRARARTCRGGVLAPFHPGFVHARGWAWRNGAA